MSFGNNVTKLMESTDPLAPAAQNSFETMVQFEANQLARKMRDDMSLDDKDLRREALSMALKTGVPGPNGNSLEDATTILDAARKFYGWMKDGTEATK